MVIQQYLYSSTKSAKIATNLNHFVMQTISTYLPVLNRFQLPGLFHRGIASSCSATTPAALNRDPASLAKRFAKLLNCSTETSEQIRDCLLQLPEAAVTAAQSKIWVSTSVFESFSYTIYEIVRM